MKIRSSRPLERLYHSTLIGVWLMLLTLGAAPQTTNPAQSATIDLREFLGAAEPRIFIHVVPEYATFPSNQTRERFEDFLEKSGPDYLVQVLRRELCLLIAEEVSKLNLRLDPEHGRSIDVRYRIDFLDGDRVLKSIYVARFGLIQDQERVLVPVGPRTWFADLIKRVGTFFPPQGR